MLMVSLLCPTSFFPCRTGSVLYNNRLATEFVLPVRKVLSVAIQVLDKTRKALSNLEPLENVDQKNTTQTTPVQISTMDTSMYVNGTLVSVRKLKAPSSALVSSCTWHSLLHPFLKLFHSEDYGYRLKPNLNGRQASSPATLLLQPLSP